MLTLLMADVSLPLLAPRPEEDGGHQEREQDDSRRKGDEEATFGEGVPGRRRQGEGQHDLEGDRARRAFNGVNVTIPSKVAALSLVDDTSEAARAIGCVNTVVKRPDGTFLHAFPARLCRRPCGRTR